MTSKNLFLGKKEYSRIFRTLQGRWRALSESHVVARQNPGRSRFPGRRGAAATDEARCAARQGTRGLEYERCRMKKCYTFYWHPSVTVIIREFFAGLDAMRSKLSSLYLESVLAFRNVIRHRRRAAFALTIIAGGIISFLLAGGFIQWVLDGMRDGAIQSQLGHIQVVRPDYFKTGIADPYRYLLPPGSKSEEEIRKSPALVALAPRLAFSGLVSLGDSTVTFVGDGVDPEGEKHISKGMWIVAGEQLSADEPNGLLLGEGLAKNIGAKVGDTIILMTTTAKGGMNAHDGRVRGLFATTSKAYDDGALRVHISLAQKLIRVQGATTWVLVLSDTDKTEATVQDLRARLDPKEAEVVPWMDLADFYQKTRDLFLKQVLIVKIMIAFIVVLSIGNTLSMAVMERTSEIGTAMALGVRRARILQLFLLEGFVLGVLGGLIGVVLGYALGELISFIGIPMPPPPGMGRGFDAKISVTFDLMLDGLILGVFTTLLASILPAWKASRMNIVDALRHQR